MAQYTTLISFAPAASGRNQWHQLTPGAVDEPITHSSLRGRFDEDDATKTSVPRCAAVNPETEALVPGERTVSPSPGQRRGVTNSGRR